MIDVLVFHMTTAFQLTQSLEESQLHFLMTFIDLSFKGHTTEFFLCVCASVKDTKKTKQEKETRLKFN